MNEWYPQNKEELNSLLNELLKGKPKNNKNIHGLITPHAGYAYSGKIAGKTYSLLKDKKFEKAVIFGPSHYTAFNGIASLDKIKTPLGEIKIIDNNLPKLPYEHSVENQIPFLQKLGAKEILPVVVGNLNEETAKKIAEDFSSFNGLFIFSTDLSHFLPYEQAVKKDRETIKIIEELNIKEWKNLDACGKSPLLILMYLCKIKKFKPKLIEYKNSGDITGEKNSVVGYAGFWF